MPKSKGKGLNISDFIMSWDEFLRDEEENTACVIHKIGEDSSRDECHWDVEHFSKQIINAINIFQKNSNYTQTTECRHVDKFLL